MRATAIAVALGPLLTLAASGSTAVRAEDISGQQPALWTGAYAGLHAGYGNQDYTGRDGVVIGGHAGYLRQTGIMVAGLEADVDWSDVGSDVWFYRASLGPVHSKTRIEHLTSLRARFGITSQDNGSMLYGTVGYAYGNFHLLGEAPAHGLVTLKDDDIHGIVGGAGIEFKISGTATARLEGLRYWVSPDGTNALAPISTVRLGVSFQLTRDEH